jgi:hypothetical protein
MTIAGYEYSPRAQGPRFRDRLVKLISILDECDCSSYDDHCGTVYDCSPRGLEARYYGGSTRHADIPSHVGNSSESRHEHWELLTEMGFIEVPMVLPSEEEYDDHTLLRRKLAK